MVKNLSVNVSMQNLQVGSLNREDDLEKDMATQSSIFAWRISWTDEPGRLYSPWGLKESDTTEHSRTLHSKSHLLNRWHRPTLKTQ